MEAAAYDALDKTAFSNASTITDVTATANSVGSDQSDVMASITADITITITDGNSVAHTVDLLATNTDTQNAALINGIAVSQQ